MEFDKLVHQPTRLQLFAYLYRHGSSTFTELQEDLDLTEGNLSSHLQRMEDAGAVTVEKEFVDRRPRTTYALTEDGTELFEEHVDTLEALIEGLDE
ncbi:MAG: DNA-binding MarR family transcriptional regulator [Halobacteriales archaeon]|jgi:DNA-binding MarR family transcriptional regulator